jgi:hypothetical protein
MIRRMRAAWHVAHRRDRRVPYRVLVWDRRKETTWKTGVEESIILIDLQYVRWGGMYLIHLVKDQDLAGT